MPLDDFNPRSPQGGATKNQPIIYHVVNISIHAPRKGERLAIGSCLYSKHTNFNPRSPQGGATSMFECYLPES